MARSLVVVAGSGRVSESACGCRLSFKTGGGVGVDARGDSGGDGVVDVEGVEGGRWTIVVCVMGNRGRNRLMVSVVVLCLCARGCGVRQGDGAETVLGGDARRVGALKRR